MDAYIEQAGLGRILAKVREGERLSLEDGEQLYQHPNVLALGALANIVRERKNGNRITSYNVCYTKLLRSSL